MQQGDYEWKLARCGSVGASKIADVMAKGRGGAPSATRAAYLGQLIAERLTGVPYEGYTNAAMQHGTETEPQARAAYTMETGRAVEEVAIMVHPTIAGSHASPDGLVGDDGLVEIKCPATHTHIDTLLTGAIPDKYVKQMQWQIACTGRDWCDFVSFDPRMSDEMQLFIQRVRRDAEAIAEIEAAVTQFLADAEKAIGDLKRIYCAGAAA